MWFGRQARGSVVLIPGTRYINVGRNGKLWDDYFDSKGTSDPTAYKVKAHNEEGFLRGGAT